MTDPLEGIWMSVSELAVARGVNKSSVSRRVDRLAEQGLLDLRPGPGGRKLVNLASFDRATSETTDAFREANGRSAMAEASPSASTSDQRRKVGYLADMLRLDLEEKWDEFCPVEDVMLADVASYETMFACLDALPGRADELCGAIASGGHDAARRTLGNLADDVRTDIAGRFAPKQSDAAELDWPKSQDQLAAIDAEILATQARLVASLAATDSATGFLRDDVSEAGTTDGEAA